MPRTNVPQTRRKLGGGMYKDVSKCLVTRGPMKGLYRLSALPGPADYRVGPTGKPSIQSIGRSLQDQPGAPKGSYFAATDGRFFDNHGFKCVWAR